MSQRPHDPGGDLGAVAVDTAAVREALTLLEEHVAESGSAGDTASVSGGVVTVLGAAGFGKSHLLTRVLETCREQYPPDGPGPARVRAIEVNASTLNADDLYRAVVDGLPKDEVVGCVEGCHTDLAVQLIGDPQLAEEAEKRLRSSARSSSQRSDLLIRLGLSPVELLERLQRDLERVVRDADHAAAFAMLIQDGLSDPAWEWLRGGEPAPVLRERGLRDPVAATLASVVSFAELYASRDLRLVMTIDDVDQMMFGADRDRKLRALEKAVYQLRDSGVLVFLSGRAETMDRLGLGRSGSGHRLVLGPFNPADLEGYVRAGSRNHILEPFDQDALERLWEVTFRNPLLVSELVSRLRRNATRHTGMAITGQAVRRETRNYFTLVDRARVAAAVRRTLDGHRWEFRPDYPIAVEPIVRVDFWLPLSAPGPEQAGCAIIIGGAVVDDSDVSQLDYLGDALRQAAVRSEALVVMTGAVSAPHAARVQEIFGCAPLSFIADSFEDDLAAAVKSMMQAFDEESGVDPLVGIRERLTELGRQQNQAQAAIQSAVSQLTEMNGRLDAQRFTYDRPAPSGLDGPRAEADRLCEEVVNQLSALGSPTRTTEGMFRRVDGKAVDDLRRVLSRGEEIKVAWGALSIVAAVVDEFRAEVSRWFYANRPSADAEASGRDLNEIERVCTQFSRVVQMLPIGELSKLVSDASEERWQDQLSRATGALGSLADRVRMTAGPR